MTDAIVEMNHFEVDGIYVEFAKSASLSDTKAQAPLLFVHGGCHGSWCWQHFLDYFARVGRDCYALNWYNHYKSTALPRAFSGAQHR